jgi:type I restriction enzyme S subunit
MAQPNFPESWKITKLGELGEISGGGTPSTKVSEYWNGDIPWLVPGEVTRNNGLHISTTERAITELGLANCVAKLLPVGTVMMTSRATIGEVVINTVPLSTNQGFINIICNEAVVHNEYLAYWIKRHKQMLEGRAHGSTFKEITKSGFKAIPIALPPIPEQLAIARALRTVQKAKEIRRKQLQLERELKAALMQRLFTRGARGEARKRVEIDEMPESWRVMRLGDILKLKSGESRPENMEEKAENKKNIPVYGGNGVMGYTDQVLLNNRVIVIGRVGEYCGCVHVADPPSWITDNALYSGKWFEEEVNLDYLAGYLDNLNLNQFRRKSGQPLVTQGILHEITVPVPSPEEQLTIAKVRHLCDDKIAILEKESALLDELFRALLEELMTGRLSATALIEAE